MPRKKRNSRKKRPGTGFHPEKKKEAVVDSDEDYMDDVDEHAEIEDSSEDEADQEDAGRSRKRRKISRSRNKKISKNKKKRRAVAWTAEEDDDDVVMEDDEALDAESEQKMALLKKFRETVLVETQEDDTDLSESDITDRIVFRYKCTARVGGRPLDWAKGQERLRGDLEELPLTTLKELYVEFCSKKPFRHGKVALIHQLASFFYDGVVFDERRKEERQVINQTDLENMYFTLQFDVEGQAKTFTLPRELAEIILSFLSYGSSMKTNLKKMSMSLRILM